MMIEYWDCKYAECDDYYTEEDGHIWIYGCLHPCNKDKYCHLDNKWSSEKDNCILLDKECKLE